MQSGKQKNDLPTTKVKEKKPAYQFSRFRVTSLRVSLLFCRIRVEACFMHCAALHSTDGACIEGCERVRPSYFAIVNEELKIEVHFYKRSSRQPQ